MRNPAAITTWAPYKPTAAAPWNVRRVVHLHRRPGFAATWDEIQRDLADRPQAAVGRFLSGTAGQGDVPSDFEVMSRTIADAAEASNNANRIKAWWLYRMLFSPDPLGERLTLMWHNHFATSNLKVDDLALMREQNDVFRRHARSPFSELLSAAVKHPAMLVWLDGDSNRKGHPNENLSREMMELFTLGVGNYAEADVKEAARALTGWTVAGNRFQFKKARHDDGEKMVLGNSDRLDGDDLLRILIDHPGTARRLAWRICHTFMGEGVVDDEALDQLASGLRQRQLDIGWGVETILRSQLFFSEANIRSRVAAPVDFVVGAIRCLELCEPPPSTLLLAEWTARMGQDLLYPPNVGGWSEGRAWLGSRAIIARANFASALVEGRLWHPAREPDLWSMVQRHQSTDDLEEALDWFGRLLWGQAPQAAVPEVLSAVDAMENDKRLSSAVALLMARPENQLA